jgi:CheY-like chemotaxis protein
LVEQRERSSVASNANRKVVLIVEDLEDVRKMFHEFLSLQGHEVHSEASGENGLEALLSLKPDIAFLDIGLPGMDGYEIAQRARAAGLTTLLVAVSGYGTEADKARAKAAGFHVHLTKPPDLEVLLSLVERGRVRDAD